MNFYKQSLELKDYLLKIRRQLHENPEIGFDLDNTVNLVKTELDKMGIEYTSPIENSVLATIGNGGRVILLRADMDALPIRENTNLEFKSENGNGHMCGHDFHTAMLLGTAKLLKENEDKLKGTVKLMFQPAEEILSGAIKMVEAGILENPKVDVACMIHMDTTLDLGVYLHKGAMATSNNNFRITVKGKGAHGAMPEKGVDATFVASQILNALQVLVSREISFTKGAVLTAGHLNAGSAPNVIPDIAIIEGTTRTYHTESKEHIKKRIPEIAKYIAKAFRGEVEFEILSDVPVLMNNDHLIEITEKYLKEVEKENPDFKVFRGDPVTASDDFAHVAERVPGMMLMLGCKTNEGEIYPLHNANAVFNEDSIVFGPTTMATLAYNWLRDN